MALEITQKNGILGSGGVSVTPPGVASVLIAMVANYPTGDSPTASWDGTPMTQEVEARTSSQNNGASAFVLENPTIAGTPTFDLSRGNAYLYWLNGANINLSDLVRDSAGSAPSLDDGVGVTVDSSPADLVFYCVTTEAHNDDVDPTGGITVDAAAGTVASGGAHEYGHEQGASPTQSGGWNNPGNDAEWACVGLSIKAWGGSTFGVHAVFAELWERAKGGLLLPREELWIPKPQVLTP